MFTNLAQGREQVDGDSSQIVSMLPPTVDLLVLNHGGDSIIVNGIAPDEAEIFTYARSLRGSGRFSSVSISAIIEEFLEDEEITRYKFEFLLR